LGLLAPVYFIPPALTAWLPGHPFVVVALAVASIVILMTYLIMPALQRMFAPWLLADRSFDPGIPARGGARRTSSPRTTPGGRPTRPANPGQERLAQILRNSSVEEKSETLGFLGFARISGKSRQGRLLRK